MLREKQAHVFLDAQPNLQRYLTIDRQCQGHDLFIPPDISFGIYDAAFYFYDNDKDKELVLLLDMVPAMWMLILRFSCVT